MLKAGLEKEKFSCGRRVDGVSSLPKCFFLTNSDRSTATLKPIIRRWILPHMWSSCTSLTTTLNLTTALQDVVAGDVATIYLNLAAQVQNDVSCQSRNARQGTDLSARLLPLCVRLQRRGGSQIYCITILSSSLTLPRSADRLQCQPTMFPATYSSWAVSCST